MRKKRTEWEKGKKQLHRIEKAQGIIKNPVGEIVSVPLIDKFPVLEKVKTIVESSLNYFQEKKREELCNIIFADNRITEEMVKDVSFIMEFYKLIEVVDRLSTNTKVEYLGKLFKNTVLLETENKYDNFNEYLYRFKDMSEREIDILYLLYEEEIEFIKIWQLRTDDDQKELANVWREFRLRATKQFSIDEAMLRSILTGIQRTGFCALETIHFACGDLSVFIITKYFMDFMELIQK